MSINATTTSSATVSNTSSSSQVSNSVSSDVSKKSTDSSFKEEMDKVSTPEKTEETKTAENDVETKVNEVSENTSDNADANAENVQAQSVANPNDTKFATLAMMDMNTQLSNDIQKMVNTNQVNPVSQLAETSKLSGVLTLDFSPSNISMSQADAEFFVNLAKTNDVSAQNVVAQAQNLLNGGVEASQVKQSAQISQTLLNALMTAKENNQPLRIDFDQNISVILRVGKDGALAANFIPGDKAVEQYLRNNIETLKNTFRENDLPYSDLSYSNRGSKQQKENRRNKQ